MLTATGVCARAILTRRSHSVTYCSTELGQVRLGLSSGILLCRPCYKWGGYNTVRYAVINFIVCYKSNQNVYYNYSSSRGTCNKIPFLFAFYFSTTQVCSLFTLVVHLYYVPVCIIYVIVKFNTYFLASNNVHCRGLFFCKLKNICVFCGVHGF